MRVGSLFCLKKYGSGGISINDHEVLLSLSFKAKAGSNSSTPHLAFADTLTQAQVVWLDDQWNVFVTEGNYINSDAGG